MVMPVGTLFVLATPLGNLSDLSARALEVLRGAPVVAAEDTRHSRRLLSAIDAHPDELVSYHAHSEPGRIAQLLAIVQGGRDLVLITDAGAPGVSDPGGELVGEVVDRRRQHPQLVLAGRVDPQSRAALRLGRRHRSSASGSRRRWPSASRRSPRGSHQPCSVWDFSWPLPTCSGRTGPGRLW